MAPSWLVKLADRLRINTSHKATVEFAWVSSRPGYAKTADLKTIREKILSQPEIYGRMLRIVNDITNGYEIYSDDPELKKRVDNFCISNDFTECLESAIFDRLLSGDGYLEPVCIRQSEAEKLVTLAYSDFKQKGFLKKNLDVASKARAVIQNTKAAKLYEPSELWWVDQRWIYKIVDEKGRIKAFTQQMLNGKVSAIWQPGELINISSFKVTNEVYGFTPLSVLLTDLYTLEDLKKFISNFFENNGVPDYLLNIKNASPNDTKVQALQATMRERRANLQRGTLIVTGDIDVQEITKIRDMDFPKLTKYMGYVMDIVWGIPPQLYAEEASATRSIDTFLAPYYTNIRKEQKKLEDILNSQLFNLFGTEAGQVKIKFNNPYLRDAVRNISWLTIAWKDGRIGPTEYRERLGMPEKDPADLKDNPFYKNQFNPAMNPANPFRGIPANNSANPDKDEEDKPSPKKRLKELGLKEGVNYS